MKKFACLFAALSLACTFTACGGDDNDDSPSKAGKGEACSAEVSCDEGLKCDADSKKCVEDKGGDKKAAEGEDCKADDACADGLVCKDKKCAKKDNGGDKKAAEGEACEADDACADGLVCKDKKCAKKDDGGDKKAAEGEACEKDDACADGLVCKDKKCAKKDGGESDVDCAKLTNTAKAVKALLALDDLTNCEALIKAYDTDMDAAMIADKVFAKTDKDADKEAAGNKVLEACAEGWGMTEEAGNAINLAYGLCNVDCSVYKETPKAYEALLAIEDLTKCEDLKKADDALDKAMVTDKIYADSDDDEKKVSAGAAILLACGDEWKIDEAKLKAASAALEACPAE